MELLNQSLSNLEIKINSPEFTPKNSETQPSTSSNLNKFHRNNSIDSEISDRSSKKITTSLINFKSRRKSREKEGQKYDPKYEKQGVKSGQKYHQNSNETSRRSSNTEPEKDKSRKKSDSLPNEISRRNSGRSVKDKDRDRDRDRDRDTRDKVSVKSTKDKKLDLDLAIPANFKELKDKINWEKLHEKFELKENFSGNISNLKENLGNLGANINFSNLNIPEIQFNINTQPFKITYAKTIQLIKNQNCTIYLPSLCQLRYVSQIEKIEPSFLGVQNFINKPLKKVVNRTAKARELFAYCIDSLQILEPEYFGIYYLDRSNQRVWLNHNKSIADQLGFLKFRSWNFYFGVKHYPNVGSSSNWSLLDPVTFNLLFCNIREDIASGHLPASFVAHVLLGSIAKKVDEKIFEMYAGKGVAMAEAFISSSTESSKTCVNSPAKSQSIEPYKTRLKLLSNTEIESEQQLLNSKYFMHLNEDGTSSSFLNAPLAGHKSEKEMKNNKEHGTAQSKLSTLTSLSKSITAENLASFKEHFNNLRKNSSKASVESYDSNLEGFHWVGF